MAYTLKDIIGQCRRQRYNIDQKSTRLDSRTGLAEVPDSLLKQYITEAVNDVNMALRTKAEVYTGACVADSDEKLLSTDVLAVKEIEMFDAATPTTEKGRQLQQVFSVELLNDGQGEPTASYVPSKYMLWENAGNQYIKFDTVCAAAYKFYLHFWPIQATLSDLATNVGMRAPYDSLIRLVVRMKVASQLGDMGSFNLANANYNIEIKDKRTLANSFRLPSPTLYKEMP